MLNSTAKHSQQQETLIQGLNPEQAQAVMADIRQGVQVMAGAGTGKTELITRRFIKLVFDLLQEDDLDAPKKLWVSTFTEKAAQEMKARIQTQLRTHTGFDLPDDAWIGTFHGLCFRMLKAHPNQSHSANAFDILANTELDLIRDNLIDTLINTPIAQWAELFPNHPLPPCSLSEAQLSDLTDNNITAFIEAIVFELIPKIKANGLTVSEFAESTPKQLLGLEHALKTLPVGPGSNMLFETYHDFAHAWEKHWQPYAASGFSFFPSELEIEQAALKAATKGQEVPSEIKLLKETLKPWLKSGQWLNHNGRKKQPFEAKTKDFTQLETGKRQSQWAIQLTAQIYGLYQALLQQEGVWDYDDIILNAVHLLQNNPSIREQYQQRFQHVLVDEFQDSNGLQLRLLQQLTPPEAPALTVVGDKKQSIYRFRYAEPENLSLAFQTAQNKPLSIHLRQNYRSTPAILNLANQVAHTMETSDTPTEPPLEPTEKKRPNEAITWKHWSEPNSVSALVPEEVAWIAEQAQALIAQGTYQPKDIAIIVRTHGRASLLESTFDRMGIPAVRQKYLGFFKEPIIQQAIALLTLANDPTQNYAWVSLLQHKLTHHQLATLGQIKKSTRTYYEALQQLCTQSQGVPTSLQDVMPALQFAFNRVTQLHSQANSIDVIDFYRITLALFPLIATQDAQTLHGQKEVKQLHRLGQYLQGLCQKSRRANNLGYIVKVLYRAMAKDDLELAVESSGWDENAIRLMTIHSAKGLEFPVVFVSGVEKYRALRGEGLLSFDPQFATKPGFGVFLNKLDGDKSLFKLAYDTVWNRPRAVQEEQRLFYVAVTRAKERLFITSCPQSFPALMPQLYVGIP